jgi:hypothetical protein
MRENHPGFPSYLWFILGTAFVSRIRAVR